MELKDSLKTSLTNPDDVWLKMGVIEARSFRIRLIVSSKSEKDYDQWSEAEAKVWSKLLARKQGETFTAEQETALGNEIHSLAALASKILALEEKRAVELD